MPAEQPERDRPVHLHLWRLQPHVTRSERQFRLTGIAVTCSGEWNFEVATMVNRASMRDNEIGHLALRGEINAPFD